MGFLEILLLAVGVSIDAFAVSVAGGFMARNHKLRHALAAGIVFGLFQVLMPLLGFMLGAWIKEPIVAFDHWAAFLLLAFVGSKMIHEGYKGCKSPEAQETVKSLFAFQTLMLLGVATSLDALAVGVSGALLDTPIVRLSLSMGVSTFLFSFAGVYIGAIGSSCKSTGPKLTIIGGAVIVLIGVKTLVQHIWFS